MLKLERLLLILLPTLLLAQQQILETANFSEDVRVFGTIKHAFGWDLATGDFNADGFSDIIIGAVLAQTDEGPTVGKAYILFGGPTLPGLMGFDVPSQFLTIIHGDDIRDYTGDAVASGDVNGDGIDDAIIGAPQLFKVPNSRGTTYIIYGRKKFPAEINLDTDGLGVPGVTRILGKELENFSGFAVAGGDINGDGFDDVIIGGYGAGPQGCCGREGEVVILFGADSLGEIVELDKLQAGLTTIHGTQDAQIGGFAGCADINNDSLWDILIGEPDYDSGDRINAGRVHIVYGTTRAEGDVDLDFPDSSNYRVGVILGAWNSDRIGWTFASADLDRDGLNELLIGTDYRRQTRSGKVYILRGKPDLPDHIDLQTYSDKLEIYGRAFADIPGELGKELATGDFNADGFPDVFVSASLAGQNGNATGEAYIFYGSADILHDPELHISRGDHDIEFRGYQFLQGFGHALAIADINGDGVDDAIIGAYYTQSENHATAGAVYIFYGRRENDSTFVPKSSALEPNYPNPFNAVTIIPYSVQEEQQITLRIYTSTGRLVRTLVDGSIVPGEHRAIWDGQDKDFGLPVASGVYFVRLTGEKFSDTRKILFLK